MIKYQYLSLYYFQNTYFSQNIDKYTKNKQSKVIDVRIISILGNKQIQQIWNISDIPKAENPEIIMWGKVHAKLQL